MKRMWDNNQIVDLVQDSIKDDKIEVKLSNLIDDENHKRFDEFEMTFTSLTNLGFTTSYAKAILNGKIFSVVLAFSNLSGVSITIPYQSTLCVLKLPEWIYNKIYPASPAANRVDNLRLYSQLNNVLHLFILRKESNLITITDDTNQNGIIVANNDSLRIQFNLIIE